MSIGKARRYLQRNLRSRSEETLESASAQVDVGAGQPPANGLQLRPVPEINAFKRDPARSLDFLDIFDEHARPGSADTTVDDPELAAAVAAISWYQTIELGHGVVTPGMFDHRPVVDHYGLPESLDGKRCLDIACSDGFWAFELERRGGDVTAIDVDSPSDFDLPSGALDPTNGQIDRMHDPFRIAHRALHSRVKRIGRSLYSLQPDDLGKFDLVHAGDVLLHLERPLEALRHFRAMTANHGLAVLADSYDPTLEGTASRYFGGFDGLLWWLPSLDCLVQMVYDAGFSEVEVTSIYNIPAWDHAEGYWRAALVARP